MNTQQQSILVVGDAETAATAKRLLEGNAGQNVRVLTRTGIEEGLALLSSDTTIVLVLLLWQGDAPEQLPDLVRSIHARQSNPLLAVMVRSRSRLPEDVGDTLWHLDVADRSFYQPVASAELVDSVAVAVRNYLRQLTLTEIPALSGIFSDARTLRDLARLSLLAVHEQRLPVRGGLFCYLGNAAHRAALIAGTGCHENHNCILLEQMENPLAKSMIQIALDQRRSQFGAEGAVIHLLTGGGGIRLAFTSRLICLCALGRSECCGRFPT